MPRPLQHHVHRVRLIRPEGQRRGCTTRGAAHRRASRILGLARFAVVCLALFVAPGRLAAAQGHPATWALSKEPLLAVGSQNGERAELFSRIAGAVRLSSGAIAVADRDSRQLRLFSPSGARLTATGRQGAGPGEFRVISGLRRCAGDSIAVYDVALLRISIFGPSGSYVRAIDPRAWSAEGLPPYDFWCNAAGVFAAVHRSGAPPAGPGPRRPLVAITVSALGRPVVTLGAFPASERYFLDSEDIPRPLGKITSIAIASDVVYVGTGDAFEVAVYSLGGERLAPVHEGRPQAPVTRSDIAAYIEDQVERRSGSRFDRKAVEQFYGRLEFPKTFPAYGRLLVDPMENLWIEDYPIPGQGVRGWSIYSRRGGRMAQLRVPSNLEIVDLGPNNVVGIWRDRLGVESVRVFGLRK